MSIIENQFINITSFENLLFAHKAALSGKRKNYYATEFNSHLASNINKLQSILRNNSYKPYRYLHKTIYEPKIRQIEAPSYRDRVVHHAIHQYLDPFYEQHFICDSYACRKGRGIHSAVSRIQHFLRSDTPNVCACQLDISKYYPSINHEKLLYFLGTKIKDPQLLNLLKIIIDSSSCGHEYDHLFDPGSYYFQKGVHGIPIGNLTSQLFANIYLHNADMYAKQQLKIKQYVRYMDDIVFFSEDKSELIYWQQALTDFIYEQLFLIINPRKVRIYPARQGVSFVGYVIHPKYILLRGSSVRRFKKHYRRQLQSVASNKMEIEKMQETFSAWKAHASHASSQRLIANLESWQSYYINKRQPTQLDLFDKDTF